MSEARRVLTGGLGVLALAGASILLTLGAFELALRWLGYEPIYAVYSHPEVFWQKDELLGWSHAPNSEGIYVGPRPWPVEFEAPVHINSLGLRGPEIAELPPDGYRVMVLGDSLVASFEVPIEQTFPALVEAELDAEFEFPVQVINAGVRGYGTDQNYLYYKERGRRLRPDLVIYVHSANDAADNVTLHRMRRIFGKGAFALRDAGRIEPVAYPIPAYALCSEFALDASYRPRRLDTAFESTMCRVQTLLSDRSALFTFLSLRIRQSPGMLLYLYRLGSPSHGAERQTVAARGDASTETAAIAGVAERSELTAAILRALADDVTHQGAELMHLVVPPYWQDLDPRDLVSPGVTVFELDVDLSRPALHYANDSHLSAQGHAAVASQLGPAIAERIRSQRAGAEAAAPEPEEGSRPGRAPAGRGRPAEIVP